MQSVSASRCLGLHDQPLMLAEPLHGVNQDQLRANCSRPRMTKVSPFLAPFVALCVRRG